MNNVMFDECDDIFLNWLKCRTLKVVLVSDLQMQFINNSRYSCNCICNEYDTKQLILSGHDCHLL